MTLEKTLTKEQKTIFNSCRKEAWKYFYPEGNGVAKKGYVLHHIDDSLRHTDVERYIQWNVDDLVMITKNEHSSLHAKGKPTWAKGKHFSESHKAKISDAMIGNTNNKGGNKFANKTQEEMKIISEHISSGLKGKMSGANNPNYGKRSYYDKSGNRHYLYKDDPRVISKEVVTLKEYREAL